MGEKIRRPLRLLPLQTLLIFCFGVRMQEGILLDKMAETVAALTRLEEAGQLYISVLTDHNRWCHASFAALGDIIIAEPGALIGFAGQRVIEQTIRQKLPEGFQRAEFLKQHGFVDMVVPRPQLRAVLTGLLDLHLREEI